MNIKRGMFRIWLAASLLWVAIAAAIAYGQVKKDIDLSYYQYEARSKTHSKPWDIDWNKSFYENFYAPGTGDGPDEFPPLATQYYGDWHQDAAKHEIEFPDGSVLFVPSELTYSDKKLLSKEFWDARFGRYFEISEAWAAFVLLPPIGLLFLGWIFGWIVRGFRT